MTHFMKYCEFILPFIVLNILRVVKFDFVDDADPVTLYNAPTWFVISSPNIL